MYFRFSQVSVTINLFPFTLYDLNPFIVMETCFLAQNVVILVHVPSALEKNVYSTMDGYRCVLCHIHQIGW